MFSMDYFLSGLRYGNVRRFSGDQVFTSYVIDCSACQSLEERSNLLVYRIIPSWQKIASCLAMTFTRERC